MKSALRSNAGGDRNSKGASDPLSHLLEFLAKVSRAHGDEPGKAEHDVRRSPLSNGGEEDCSAHLSCSACEAAGCTYCQGKHLFEYEFLRLKGKKKHEFFGACVPKSDHCENVQFGELKDLLSFDEHIMGIHMKSSWEVVEGNKKQKTKQMDGVSSSMCTDIEWPRVHASKDEETCKEEGGGWCKIDITHGQSVHLQGAVCLSEGHMFVCNADILKSWSFHFSPLKGGNEEEEEEEENVGSVWSRNFGDMAVKMDLATKDENLHHMSLRGGGADGAVGLPLTTRKGESRFKPDIPWECAQTSCGSCPEGCDWCGVEMSKKHAWIKFDGFGICAPAGTCDQWHFGTVDSNPHVNVVIKPFKRTASYCTSVEWPPLYMTPSCKDCLAAKDGLKGWCRVLVGNSEHSGVCMDQSDEHWCNTSFMYKDHHAHEGKPRLEWLTDSEKCGVA